MKLALFALLAAALPAQTVARVDGKALRIEFDRLLHSRVVFLSAGRTLELGPSAPSEWLTTRGAEVRDFRFRRQNTRPVRDQLGAGRRFEITGEAPGLRKTLAVTVYDEFPNAAFFDVSYTNTGKSDLQVEGWTSHRYTLNAAGGEPPFWSYQSGSYRNRPDWVLPLKPGFQQENFLGMNATDYGGGTPVVDVWRRDAGLAVGHVELSPKLVSLPVAMPDASQATLAVAYKTKQTLKPGAALKTFRTFVAVHTGDYFQTLVDYRRVMARQGVAFQPSPESAFGPIWCAWGYRRDFVPAQVYNTLPIVKKLGFTWVTLDDGWQTAEGDWFLNPQKFPNGDRDMRALVDRVHADGFRAQLWWAPLAAKPGAKLVESHPEQLLLNADGSQQRISYWNSWYLCPADPAVVEYHRNLVIKMIRDWDYDGLKLDGQFMNGAPPCYNPAHKHARPEDAVEGLPNFFRALFEAARSVKPDAVVEFCPCGTAYSFFNLPHMNMSVASDPRGSWQIRTKAKTLKALHGDAVAFFGDHVELSDGRLDFASTVGVGGVVGSEFTWPVGAAPRSRSELTPEREQVFAKWLRIYRDKMLSRGEYQGALYDIGFDRPEAHAVRKGGAMYYAFFAPDYAGKVELRGLAARSYRVADYENGLDLGSVRGPAASLDVRFQKHLLLEARPE